MPDYSKLIGDGKCANPRCKTPAKRLGQIFRRIRIDHGVINVQAANTLLGLSQMMGGSAQLAEAFDPTPEGDHVRFSGDKKTMARVGSEDIVLTTFCVCLQCYSDLPVWLLEPTRSVEELSRPAEEKE